MPNLSLCFLFFVWYTESTPLWECFHLVTSSPSWFPGVSSRSWLLFVSFALAYSYQTDPSSSIPFETCHLFGYFLLPSVATLGSPRMSPVEPPWFVSLPVASLLYQAHRNSHAEFLTSYLGRWQSKYFFSLDVGWWRSDLWCYNSKLFTNLSRKKDC